MKPQGTTYEAIEVGPLPAAMINRTLGTELVDGIVRVSRTAHRHIAQDHAADYPLVMAHLEAIVRAPTYLGQAPRHGRNIELVKRVRTADGLGYVLVAIGLEPDGRGDYAVRSAYVVRPEQVERRRQTGHLLTPK